MGEGNDRSDGTRIITATQVRELAEITTIITAGKQPHPTARADALAHEGGAIQRGLVPS